MITCFFYVFSIVITVPYKHGIYKYSKFNSYIEDELIHRVNTNQQIKHILYDISQNKNTYFKTMQNILTIGGDHSISIGSVFASNDMSIMNNKSLGILWFDTCTDMDFQSKQIEDNTVKILCGHTHNDLAIGKKCLNTSQFAYFGLQDLNYAEEYDLKKYNMTILTSISSILKWSEMFDHIHLSFDSKCLNIDNDYSTTCYNTIICLMILESLHDNLISMDFIHYENNYMDLERYVIQAMCEKSKY